MDDVKVLVEKCRELLDNYLVEDVLSAENADSRVCAIYFSSNGLVPPPKTVERCCREILIKNRFEWYGTRIARACRHIFVRDVDLIWYRKGISTRCSSVKEVVEVLKPLTEGYEVVCVGSSAGGYASMLFACLLNAKMCFAFSPCMDVRRFVLKNRESRKSEYWQEKYDALVNDPDEFSNLGKLCAGHGNSVYAYFPTKSELDAEELKDAHAVPCIRLFLHDSKVHGFSFSRAVAERLINLSHEELTGLYSGKVLTDREIAATLAVDIREVSAKKKTLKYKYGKYGADNLWEYLWASTLFKAYRKLREYFQKRGMAV